MDDAELLAKLDLHYPPPMTPAERTRAWREAMKASGRPDTKNADSAIVEAQCFLMSLPTTMPILVPALALVKVATIILVRSGYDRELSQAVVLSRLARRDVHDRPGFMPSRALVADDADVLPPSSGSWSKSDTSYIRSLPSKMVSTPVTSSKCNEDPAISRDAGATKIRHVAQADNE